MSECRLCPRNCGADRAVRPGVCGVGARLRVGRAAPHFWEEPVISGYGGSGAVFFSGCALKCVYCQNRPLSFDCAGEEIDVQRLKEIYKELIDDGVHNINLVTPTQWADRIAESLDEPPGLPVIYNCGGYEKTQTLRLLEGKIQIYLPDLKYLRPEAAKKYSAAPDYPAVATAAIREMFRQTGPYRLDREGLMQRGVLIRHMMLPGETENTLDVIDWVSSTFPKGTVLFSLMAQYTPQPGCTGDLARRVTREEYERAVDYLYLCDLQDGFVQEPDAADAAYIPSFDGTGVKERAT